MTNASGDKLQKQHELILELLFDEGLMWYQTDDPFNTTRAQMLIELAAEQELPCAMARCMLAGWGGRKRQPKKAFRLMKEMAENGALSAQFILGYCYEHGEGVLLNEEKAAAWYTKAAEQGSVPAQFSLELEL